MRCNQFYLESSNRRKWIRELVQDETTKKLSEKYFCIEEKQRNRFRILKFLNEYSAFDNYYVYLFVSWSENNF